MITFDEAVALLKANFDDRLGSNTVEFIVGETARNEHNSPRSVAFVGSSGRFAPLDESGGPIPYVTDSADYAGQPLMLRNYDTEIDVWGADAEEADALLRNVVRTLYEVLGPRGLEMGSWEELEADSIQRDGVVIRLECMIKTYVLSEWDQLTVTITEATHNHPESSFDDANIL